MSRGIIRYENRHLSMEWHSLEAMIADLEEQNVYPWLNDSMRNLSVRWPSWMGFDNPTGGFPRAMATFTEKMVNGWPEARENMERCLSDIEVDIPMFATNTETRRRKRRRSDNGDELLQERLWAGDLENMWVRPERVTERRLNSKTVTLFFDAGISSGVEHSQSMWRAAVGMYLVTALTRSGRSVEVWVGNSTSDALTQRTRDGSYVDAELVPRYIHNGVMVKSSDQPLNEDRMASMLSAAFFRTYIFGAYWLNPEKLMPYSRYGYSTAPLLPFGLRQRKQEGDDVIIVTGALSKHEAVNRCRAIVAGLGAEAEEVA